MRIEQTCGLIFLFWHLDVVNYYIILCPYIQILILVYVIIMNTSSCIEVFSLKYYVKI